jgi:hypothetical protein
VVASEKQYIIRVDSVDDVEAYNNYDEKIEIVRRSRLWKKTCPKTYCHGNEKVSREGHYNRLANC